MDDALLALTPYAARTAAAIVDRLFPADENGPAASEIGVVRYLDRALAGAYRDHGDAYRLGLDAVDRAARSRFGTAFADCAADRRDALLADLEQGRLPDFHTPPQTEFFALLRAHLQEGLFADPAHGGNRDRLGWKFLGHPGVWFDHTAEENLATEPVTKGGEVRALADAGRSFADAGERVEWPGYDPQLGALPPSGPADVVLVGMGAVGSFVAPILTGAGLRVVALEAGPYRTRHDYLPDELGAAYYCRGDMGAKFLGETPRWRRNEDEPTRAATFSLGRMMNGVGGSVVHWGGALRRLHPHHFRFLSHVREAYGEGVLPEGHAVADWPIGYDELESYYTAVEYAAGVAGDGSNPFLRRSRPYPMPPLRTFRLAEVFRAATGRMGLHPHPTPVCVNSVPYNGLPATRYHPWGAGFGAFFDDRWNPGLTSVPEALASGNLELRTHCRVLRVLTDRDGHANGVEYADANGVVRVQRARTVIVCGYTFENVRLLLLSRDDRHPGGLGNDTGQVGRYFMCKPWDDVFGDFPGVVFNGHTGPAAQMWGVEDFQAASFDSAAHGFVGGATYNIENQRLPIQVSRDPLPPGVRAWGKPYKDHIRRWQHVAALRIQPDALPYHDAYLDLDPVHRDRSGFGLPVVRITTDLHPNEHRLLEWMETTAETILREMGAAGTWRGRRLRGVCSSHDLGGARMGEDPRTSVVDRDLRVHDTAGLYVMGGAVFPTCHGVNPQLTIWALAMRAAERLVERLRLGEER